MLWHFGTYRAMATPRVGRTPFRCRNSGRCPRRPALRTSSAPRPIARPLPAPGAKVPVVLPTPVDSRLSNGIRAIPARTGDVPPASITALVRAGASTDPRAKAGRASLAAQIADKGTATRSADQIAADFEKLGATFATQVDLDGTYLSVTARLRTSPRPRTSWPTSCAMHHSPPPTSPASETGLLMSFRSSSKILARWPACSFSRSLTDPPPTGSSSPEHPPASRD